MGSNNSFFLQELGEEGRRQGDLVYGLVNSADISQRRMMDMLSLNRKTKGEQGKGRCWRNQTWM